MREKDATLQYWTEKIDFLNTEYERAKTNTSNLHDPMESAWQSLHDLQERYREYKELANHEFQESQCCWSMHDGLNAKKHSENGHILNEKKAEIGLSLDRAHARFDSAKSQFDRAVAYQRGIKVELNQARKAHKQRIEELKEQNLQEQMHWKEKSCGRCKAIIRYNDTWNHIPNYCKTCKEKMNVEREEREKRKAAEAAKWKEKPCKSCGKAIRYNIDWSNIPNYCEKCKAERREKEKKRQEKPCRGCRKTIIYYTDWSNIPNYCEECYKKGNFWTKPVKPPQPKEGYNIRDYSHGIKKQNSKDLSQGEFGEHKWYNPRTGQMGTAGQNYAGKRRKPRYENLE